MRGSEVLCLRRIYTMSGNRQSQPLADANHHRAELGTTNTQSLVAPTLREVV